MNSIIVDDVYKNFKVYNDKSDSLKEKLIFAKRNKYERRKVLDGVSFAIKKGEAVGLIGVNGCGKSTLLKMISRIMYPTKGTIKVNGRISSLIELGAGFHPDMSGRENIFINASILGLKRKEIESRLEDIINFSELGSYIDNPIRTYSSGMYMRLAFSVAINVDADILLIDEILAVGDAAFQAKCFEKLRRIKENGTTIIIVSHSLGQIEQLCDRAIWINKGKIILDGKPAEVGLRYMEYIGRHENGETLDVTNENVVVEEIEETVFVNKPDEPAKITEASEQEGARNNVNQGKIEEEIQVNRYGNKDIIFTKVMLMNEKGEDTRNFITGERFVVRAYYERKNNDIVPVFGVGINGTNDTVYYGTNTFIDRYRVEEVNECGYMEFMTNFLPLLTGKYTLDVAMHDEFGVPYDYWKKCLEFKVFSTIPDAGLLRVKHSWNLVKEEKG